MTSSTAAPTCTFCGATYPFTIKIIAGPDVMICAGCVEKSLEIVNSGGGIRADAAPTPPPDHQAGLLLRLFSNRRKPPAGPWCSFCGKAPLELGLRVLVQPPTTRELHELICSECLGLCQDIIQEEHATKRDG